MRLRPLTLLVGRNSSGKSSFLRFLPLLRQSVEAPTTGPIQWYGDYVDFGGFGETVSSFADGGPIRFGFSLQLRPDVILARMRHQRYLPARTFKNAGLRNAIDCVVAFTIVPDAKDNSITRCRSIAIDIAGHTIELAIEGLDRVRHVVVNGQEPMRESYQDLRLKPGALLPLLYRRTRSQADDDSDLRYAASRPSRPLAIAPLVALLRPMFHGNTTSSTIGQVAHRVPLGTDQQILEFLQRLGHLGRQWASTVSALPVSGRRFGNIRNLLLANSLGAIIHEIDRQLWIFATGIRYVKPVRATAQRYYRPQDFAVGEIDPAGKNFAMFLRSLTDAERGDFNDWMSTELDWTIGTSLAGGHVSLSINDRGSNSHNLTDVGFGFSQLLPVIAQLWFMQRPRFHQRFAHSPEVTFAIEQPELHLHPGLQARLADILIRAINSAQGRGISLRVVAETHSEALINRLGQRIASGKFSPDDAAVVLFEPDGSSGVSTVSTATFRRDGFLENWPFGFFEP